ncbi:MAG: response regulator [Bdellovibrionota bacterium]|jgi:DNA-binding NarL/FixJ family response regulator
MGSFDQSLSMGPLERSRACVLIVEPDAIDRSNMRSCLKDLGFGGLSDVSTHIGAFEKLEQRHFTHLIFDARPTNMPVVDFVKKIMECMPEIIMIPTSFEPDVDDVFDLFILGAKGYLVKPFTAESVDDAIVNATKGEPIAEVVLNAKDRNEALVAILMQSLDITATIIRQAQQFETAKRELPRALNGLRRSSELAKTFSKGGEEGLLESIQKFCIERSQGPATRLGRLRKRLRSKRADGEI